MADPEPTVAIPEHVSDLATACNFKIRGWEEDSDDAIVEGVDVQYIGTKAECVAFMTAWQQCVGLKVRQELIKDSGDRVSRGVLGFYASAVAPTQSVQVTVRPQTGAFRGDRVAIPDFLADYYVIDDIRVGNRSSFLNSTEVPGSAWAANLTGSLAAFIASTEGNRILKIDISKAALKEFGRPHSMNTCNTAMDLTIIATNISVEVQPFRAFILGRYAS
jgi:hypothetical protein